VLLLPSSRRQVTPERVTIFTDARAASDGWPRRSLALAKVRAPGKESHRSVTESRPDITLKIRWCPAHKGAPGNEKADEWAKLAPENPDGCGVE